jgi:5-(carboxyamino)imidazole ribonucleotide mutase
LAAILASNSARAGAAPVGRGEIDRVHPALQRVEAAHQSGLGDHRRKGDLGVVDAAFLQQQLDVVEAGVVVGRVGGHGVLQLLERAQGVALGQRFLRGGFLGSSFGLFGAGHVLVEELADLLGRNGADEAVHRLAVLEHHAERDAAHAEHLGQLRGNLRHLVGVELGQREAPGVLDLELFEHRAQLLAGAAPFGPDVQQHRGGDGAFDQFGLEIFESDVDHRNQLRVKRKIETMNETIQVGVVMGSSSDWETMRNAVEILQQFGISHEAKVVSAHRMPDALFAYAESAAGRGLTAIIAGAGGAAHLPGMLASKTTVPVLGVPVASRHLQGVDSLYSIVQMPKGVPVATFAIGNAGAANAALFAVAMLAVNDPALRAKLDAFRTAQTAAAEAMTLPPAPAGEAPAVSPFSPQGGGAL